MTRRPTEATPGYLLAFAVVAGLEASNRNLTAKHLQMLALICARGTSAPMTFTEMAPLLNTARQLAGKWADRLVQHGLIQRTEAETDRRLYRLVPTQAGLDLNALMQRHFHTALTNLAA